MNMSTKRISFLSAAMSLALATGIYAASPKPAETRGGRQGLAQAETPLAGEVSTLQGAFNTLMGADHDYQGHRIKAMRAIAVACRVLGTDIVPAGLKEKLEAAGAGTQPAGTQAAGTRPGRSEPEGQSASDTTLHTALTTVQQVLSGIPSGQQPRVAERLQEAVSELNLALSDK